AAVHGALLGLLDRVGPVVADDVVLVTLLGVEVAVGLAGAADDAVGDLEGVVLDADELEAGEVLAVEDRREAVVGVGGGRGGEEGGRGARQGEDAVGL